LVPAFAVDTEVTGSMVQKTPADAETTMRPVRASNSECPRVSESPMPTLELVPGA
jgi:hypothetical protein